MCKICTYQAFIQFALFENITYVPSNDSPILLKQFCHLRLRKLDGVSIHPYVHRSLSIFCLVNYNLAIHFHISIP